GPQPLAGAGGAYTADGRTGLAALTSALACRTPEDLDQRLSNAHLDRAGELLFELLFGPDEARYLHVLSRTSGTPAEPCPTPTRFGLRVRVLTDVPALLGLPWRLVMWRGFLLSDNGWTVEVCSRPDPPARIDYRSPGRVLVIAPPAVDQ